MNVTAKNEIEKEIADLEKELMAQQEKLTALRKKIPAVEVADYIFKDKDGKEIRLSEMFGDKKELMLVHNMGKGCPYCTLWADEYNGVIHHLENRVPFVVISPDAPEVMKNFAGGRNWKFRIYSSAGNTFKKDVGFETEDKMVLPGVSVFRKDDAGKIWHANKASFGPGDLFCGLWHFFDLLEDGAGNWNPKYNY
ncbi:MAG TPA: DUF899 family protein [Bacteroidia bacterium]|jgi:predicted dithiol-disulfide oxidoreductase (DUF899 family)